MELHKATFSINGTPNISGSLILKTAEGPPNFNISLVSFFLSGGQAVLGRQLELPTPWLTERHGYDPTYISICISWSNAF